MKTTLLVLFLSLGQFAFAQDEPDFPDMRSWGINYSDTTDRYIFADTALIRVSPDTKQAASDTLFAGDNITVTGMSRNALSIRGLKGPWLKIKYTKNGEAKTGFIWQGLVSCMPLRRGDVKFVLGIERRADSITASGKVKDTTKRFLFKLKVVKQGVVLAKNTFTTFDDESANYCFGKIMSGMGLTNVQNMVVISIGGEACGIPEYCHYFAFTKSQQLVRFPKREGISEAGVYYHGETFTFPNEKGGKPDQVLWEKTVEESTDKVDKNGNEIMKVTERKNAVYTWDGASETISGSVKK